MQDGKFNTHASIPCSPKLPCLGIHVLLSYLYTGFGDPHTDVSAQRWPTVLQKSDSMGLAAEMAC
jgi:hypothetical protein